jgi:hypothetical protein
MKLSELEVGVEYAIHNSFTFTKRNAIDVNNVAKHHVYKATLVSKDKYYWKDIRPSKEEADFSPAPKKETKGVGLLFKLEDDNKQTFYYVTRLASVIARHEVVELVWTHKEQEEKRLRAEQEAQEAIIRAKKKQVQEHAERARLTMPNTIKSILGGKLYDEVNIEIPYFSSDNAHARVSITLRDMERLIELVYDKKEEVA